MLATNVLPYAYLFAAALLVGFSKTSVGGMVILAVPLVALGFPSKESTGLLLVLMVFADTLAVLYYRRSCNWSLTLRFFPITAFGVILGYFLMDAVSVRTFNIILGAIIAGMLLVGWVIDRRDFPIKDSFAYAVLIGIIVGLATMMANAAGPLLGIYFLQLGLEKKEFIGTRSWYFLVLNGFKVPFSVSLGLIDANTLVLASMYVPVILLGAGIGCVVIDRINASVFKICIRAAAGIAAATLIASSL